MLIEIGTLYQTRDGLQARVYAVACGPGANYTHGAVYETGEWRAVEWTDGGNYYGSFDNGPHSYDLTSLWPIQPVSDDSPSTAVLESPGNFATVTLSQESRFQLLTDLTEQLGLYQDFSDRKQHPLYIDKPTKWEDQ